MSSGRRRGMRRRRGRRMRSRRRRRRARRGRRRRGGGEEEEGNARSKSGKCKKYAGKKVAQQAIKLDKPGAKLMNEKNRAVVMQN